MKILVTGGFGLIGANAVKRLAHEGHQVVLFDKTIERETDFFDGSDSIEFEEGDVTNHFTVTELFAKHRFDAIIHSAANLNGMYCKAHPTDAVETNTIGTLTLLELARIHHIQKFIYIGSGSVFGKQTSTDPIDETVPATPMNTYATTKRLSEELLHCYRVNYGMETINIRVSWVFGPLPTVKEPRWSNGPIAYYTYKVLTENQLEERTGRDFIANFTYVDDVTEGIVRLLETDEAPPCVHLSSEQLYGNQEIIEFLQQKCPESNIRVGKGAEPFVLQAPIRGPLVSIYKEQIGYKPSADFRESLEAYFTWLKTELKKRNEVNADRHESKLAAVRKMKGTQ